MYLKLARHASSFVIGLLVATVAFLLMSQALVPQVPQGRAQVEPLIVTSGLTIVDSQSKQQLICGHLPDGDGKRFGMSLRDSSGSERIRLAFSEEDGPEIALISAAGHVRFLLGTVGKDTVSLDLCGNDGGAVASLVVKESQGESKGYLLVRDSHGKYLCTLPSSIAEGK